MSKKSLLREWAEALVFAGVVVFILRTFVFGLYHVPTGSAEPTLLVGDRVLGNKLSTSFGSKPKRGDTIIFDDVEFKYDQSNNIQYFWQKYIGFPISILGLKSGPQNFTKRVIGLPGDWLEGKIEDGKPVIYLNSKKIDESYVSPYPLILVKKIVGLIDFDLVPILSFLKQRYEFKRYPYDPDVSFENQPFYQMKKSEVVLVGGFPYFAHPYTPTYKNSDESVCADAFGPIKIPANKYWLMGDNRKGSRDSRWFGFVDESMIHGKVSYVLFSIDSEEPVWFLELLKHPIDFWTKSIRWNRFFKKPVPIPRKVK